MSAAIARLSLREVAQLLSYKNVRSARRWCEHQGVTILRDAGTKFPYVIKSEFDAARLNSLVAYLFDRYGAEHWKKALLAYQAGDLEALTLIKHKASKSYTDVKKNIVGTNASRFYADLRKSISGKQK